MAISTSGNVKLGGATARVSLSPTATFLRTSNDPLATGAVLVDFSAYGFVAGDVLVMEAFGDLDLGTGMEIPADVIGVMSSSSTLLGGSNTNRVPGAITAIDPLTGGSAPGVTTVTTQNGGYATDIAQDFAIGNVGGYAGEAVVEVPAGAGYLFLGLNDGFLGDNADANNDFGVEIQNTTVIAQSGTGALTITSGTEAVNDIVIAGQAGANGTLTIQSGATLNVGDLAIVNGGGLTTSGSLVTGLAANTTSTINVNGGTLNLR
ncbi:MAG: hypothetical protein AAFO58_11060, partial [Pseudomonadota bacterium]